MINISPTRHPTDLMVGGQLRQKSTESIPKVVQTVMDAYEREAWLLIKSKQVSDFKVNSRFYADDDDGQRRRRLLIKSVPGTRVTQLITKLTNTPSSFRVFNL